MLQNYKKRKERFAQNIYRYCDNYVGEKALFPVFTNLYPELGKRKGTSLARHTSKIINKLVLEGVLKEIPKDPSFSTPYGLYLILEHKRLVDEIGFGNGKAGEMIRDEYNFDFTREKIKL